MIDQGNRTFIGSVLFVEIVDYSKKTVSEQIVMKDHFITLLAESLREIDPEQRIILDTGDGAAMSFLGDPEDALFVSMHMRDYAKRLVAHEREISTTQPLAPLTPAAGATTDAGGKAVQQTLPATNFALRIGINLGPVKLIRDINGQPNIVGDGISVSQRIMHFAKPGQIVVSRSYFEVVSVVSDDYAKLFNYEGSRTDKHVREHEIYVVGDTAAPIARVHVDSKDRASATQVRREYNASTGSAEYSRVTNDQSPLSGITEFLQDGKKLAMTGAALGLVVVALIAALAYKRPKESAAPKTELAQTAPARVPGTVAPVPPPAQSTLDLSLPSPIVPPGSSASTSEEKKIAKPEAPKSAIPLAQGTVSFSIQPWGEVLVNGKSIGASPPMKQTKLNPGKHRIEVRNTDFPPYITTIELKAKEEASVAHKFQ